MAEEIELPYSPCKGNMHGEHLCTLTENYFHVHEAEKFREMVKEAEFKCQFCGRIAKCRENLCYATKL